MSLSPTGQRSHLVRLSWHTRPGWRGKQLDYERAKRTTYATTRRSLKVAYSVVGSKRKVNLALPGG
jgi:hypothetical protein